MPEEKSPRLRTVEKVTPPYPLNEFPKEFGFSLGREIVYLLATKGNPILEGPEWEQIFAICVNARWKPSNVGLDDVILDTCVWGAKTVKATRPAEQKTVRLISGRNAPVYSFGKSVSPEMDPNQIGSQILSIWNERVSGIRKKHKHVRTVVLIKSSTLQEVAVFEFDTVRYEPDLYAWSWNRNRNLEGFDKATKVHRFTWQPHGSQFTIVEDVPERRLIVRIKSPPVLDKGSVLKRIGFDKSWVTVFRKNG
jgi:hypothetical protein